MEVSKSMLMPQRKLTFQINGKVDESGHVLDVDQSMANLYVPQAIVELQ
jgi:hypothetical protein